ncbi:MAG: glycosyltransferase domain-containing protein [Candidatus Paceibacterota bacterium]|jgi:hypothetical protein
MYSSNVGQYRPERTDIKVYTEDKLNNPHYSSRLYKILSHIYDPVEWSVYVDADIFLPEGMEQKLIDEVKASGQSVGVFKHPWRDCVYEEAEEIIRLGKDEVERIVKQMKKLREVDHPEHSGLAACGVLVRNNRDCIDMNNAWWSEVCSESKRDQLSFPDVFKGNIHYFDGDIYQYKSWKR